MGSERDIRWDFLISCFIFVFPFSFFFLSLVIAVLYKNSQSAVDTNESSAESGLTQMNRDQYAKGTTKHYCCTGRFFFVSVFKYVITEDN